MWQLDKDQVPVWIGRTKEEIESFNDGLIEDSLHTATTDDLPIAVQKKLNDFVKETLVGVQRLENSNKKLSHSLETLVSGGFDNVDIIIPVYNSGHVVKTCLESINKHTIWPHELTIVNDCSNEHTSKFIDKEWQDGRVDQVITNTKNRGFAASVNRGIRETNNPYICIVNSDVIVTSNWLTKMMMALHSDPKNKIVNPCTNNTALINIPLQQGASYLDMNRALESSSSHIYPEIMPTGFCWLMSRQLFDDIGGFDEGYGSYGEETDLWMRTITRVHHGAFPRWKAVLADDTYIFHERGTSFSGIGNAAHMEKRKAGAERFHSIWPGFKQWQKSFNIEEVMKPFRSELSQEKLKNPKSKYDIAFVVHSVRHCGGMKFISDIVNYLNENDVNAKVVQIKREKEGNETPLGELRTAPIVFETYEDFVNNFTTRVFTKGVVVAATNELMGAVQSAVNQSPDLTSILFAQSYDPAISPTEEMKELMEEAFHTPDHIVTNSKWLNDKIQNEHKVQTLGWARPGYDNHIFYPRDRSKGDDRPTFMVALNTSYPFKGHERGIDLAEEVLRLAKENKKDIRVLAHGVTSVQDCIEIIGLGDLPQTRLAEVLGTEVDVFCDPSHIHTYGLPTLEAMACGTHVVSWDNKGVKEYLDTNVFKNNTDPKTLAKRVFDLLTSKSDSLKPRSDQYREDGVKKFVEILERGLDLNKERKKIAIVTPHLRKHGGPSTIIHMANILHDLNHDVDLYTVYPDMNPEILNEIKANIRVDTDNILPCDVLVSNSDNPKNDLFVEKAPAKKKVMLKLSHNPRFQQLEDDSLKLDWDEIVTSTEWLKEVCANPLEGWTHPAKEATRIGWFHYGHQQFSCPPSDRMYNKQALNIGLLAHHHPLKGTQQSVTALELIKQKYQQKVNIGAVGEWAEFQQQKPEWMQYFYCLNRQQMADLMKQIDIWVSSSHTEGLGRMSLEAMSASVCVVMSDTGAEFAVDGENCLIVPKNEPEAIAEAVEKLVLDVSLRKSISSEAHRTASKWSDPKDYIQNIERVICS